MDFQGEQLSFRLSDDQAEVIQRKLPNQYCLLQGLPKREQRMAKKVNKYDASFAEAQTPRQHRASSNTTKKSHDTYEDPLIQKAPKYLSEEMKRCYVVFQKLQTSPAYLQLQQLLYNGFKTIEKQFWDGHYTQLQFWGDVQKLLQELSHIYHKENQIHYYLVQLENYFNELYKTVDYEQTRRPPHPQPKKQPIKSNAIPKMDTPMSAKEKRILGQNIRDLSPEHLRGVWEIVSQGGNLGSGEELEFDIDTLPPKIARQLEKYVNQKLQIKQKSKKVKYEQPTQKQMQPHMIHMGQHQQLPNQIPPVSGRFITNQPPPSTHEEDKDDQPNETDESSFISGSNDSE